MDKECCVGKTQIKLSVRPDDNPTQVLMFSMHSSEEMFSRKLNLMPSVSGQFYKLTFLSNFTKIMFYFFIPTEQKALRESETDTNRAPADTSQAQMKGARGLRVARQIHVLEEAQRKRRARREQVCFLI